jgi:pyruvate-formate lyase-activating enzyme
VSQYIRVETTNVCNLRCSFCPQSTPRGVQRGYMSAGLFRKIVSEVAPFPENRLAPFYLHICGEPLLHPSIGDFVQIVAEAGLRPVLTTNANLLDEAMASRLIAAGLKGIEFSFEGLDKDTYEAFRIRGHYAKVLGNIEGFLRLNEAAGHPVHTELVVVDIPEVAPERLEAFCRSMEPRFDTVNRAAFFDWLGQVEGPAFSRGSYSGCSAPLTDLNVLWDGRVVPCCMDVDGAMVIGDFTSMSYLEILAAEARRLLQGRLNRRELAGLACERCPVPWQGCRLRQGAKNCPTSGD